MTKKKTIIVSGVEMARSAGFESIKAEPSNSATQYRRFGSKDIWPTDGIKDGLDAHLLAKRNHKYGSSMR